MLNDAGLMRELLNGTPVSAISVEPDHLTLINMFACIWRHRHEHQLDMHEQHSNTSLQQNKITVFMWYLEKVAFAKTIHRLLTWPGTSMDDCSALYCEVHN